LLTTSKIKQRYLLIILSVMLTQFIWLGSKWFFGDWFEDPFKYPAKFASLSALILMAWCIILSARLRRLEDYFGGLDKVYQVHKHLGKFSFWLIILHPAFLYAKHLPDLTAYLQALFFRLPPIDRYLWGHNLGVAALLIMFILIALTLWYKLAYHRWKKTHEFMGLLGLVSLAHIFLVEADVAKYPLLAIWVYAWLLAGLAAFVYIRFFYARLGPRFFYRVSALDWKSSILHLELSPVSIKMDYRPSQFVYLVVHKAGISEEPHPYSIASGYNLGASFKLGIKDLGDHTHSLRSLETGDRVSVYGPYGHFSEKYLSAQKDCVFIGSGIGITPFMGMWHVALHSEERRHGKDLPEKLKALHPEIMRTWRGPLVHLFYVCRHQEDASFVKDLEYEVYSSHYHGFEAFEKRGHSYELYLSSEKGRFSAEYADQRVIGGLKDKYIFICGPSLMMEALIEQLDKLGVPHDHIVVEDFNLY
jgi:predicted ferric reductase